MNIRRVAPTAKYLSIVLLILGFAVLVLGMLMTAWMVFNV